MTTHDDGQALDPGWSDLGEMRRRAAELLNRLNLPAAGRRLTAERCAEAAHEIHGMIARYVPNNETVTTGQQLLSHLVDPSPLRPAPDPRPWIAVGLARDEWVDWCMIAAIQHWRQSFVRDELHEVMQHLEDNAAHQLSTSEGAARFRRPALADTREALARVDLFWTPLAEGGVTASAVRTFLLRRLEDVARKAAFLWHSRNETEAVERASALRPEEIPDRSEWSSWVPPAADNTAKWVKDIQPVIATIARKKARCHRVPSDVLISDMSVNLLSRDTESARHPDGSRLQVGDQELEKYLQTVCNNAWNDRLRAICLRARRELADQGAMTTSHSDLRSASEYSAVLERLTFVDTRRTSASRLAELWRQTTHESTSATDRMRSAMILEGVGAVVERALAHGSPAGIRSYTAQVLTKGARSDGVSRSPLREVLWQQSYVPRGFADPSRTEEEHAAATQWLYHDTNERPIKQAVRSKGLRRITSEILLDELEEIVRWHNAAPPQAAQGDETDG